MNLVILLILFVFMMVVLMGFRRPLWMGTLGAVILAVLLYGVPLMEAGRSAVLSLINRSAVEVLAVIYCVNFLQVMMQKKGKIDCARESMMRLLNSRRSIIIFAPVFMGLLPAPNAVTLSAPIVDSSAENYLSKGEKTFLTSYFRHIPESTMPLYPGLLLAISVTGLQPGIFLLTALPLVVISVLFCYFTVLRKVPKDTGQPKSENRLRDLGDMFLALWPVMALIAAVLFFGFNTAIAAAVTSAAIFLIYRFRVSELCTVARAAFSPPLMLAMALVMVLKDIVAATGVIQTLPDIFGGLPIPMFLMYAVITFIGGLAGLGNAIIAVLFPVAFSTIPGAGIPLLVLLMSFSHSAAQISPTHVCLEIAVNCFKSDFRSLILKSLPVTAVYCAAAVLYYILLAGVKIF